MDLDGLFKRAFDGFGESPEPSGFPGVPGRRLPTGNGQDIDTESISRSSRISRSESKDNGGNDFGPEDFDFSAVDDCAREVPFKSPGTPGTPGNEGKNPAVTTLPQFPVKDREPGTPGTERAALRAPILDLNRAAPQHSDWWSGPAMAEADRAAPPLGDPLPIGPADVRAGVARELRALAEDGREGSAALRDAVEITQAKIRNSEALAERQAHGGRCHVCHEPLDDSAPVVAVLSWSRGAPLHLHAGCCPAYSARRIALVDSIMAAAGYGAEAKGEAA